MVGNVGISATAVKGGEKTVEEEGDASAAGRLGRGGGWHVDDVF
jgi:hypothetical protein